MSSHHVVKEKQEPALIVDNIDVINRFHLEQLLEWTPTVLTNNRSALKLMRDGTKVDIVFTTEEIQSMQDGVEFVPLKDQEFMEAALCYLVKKEYPAANLISGNVDLNGIAFFLDKINLVIIHHNKKTFPIKTGFKKWQTQGEIIEFNYEEIPVNTSGLKKLDHKRFQTTRDGFYEIFFDDSRYLFITENL
ncbi:hypothetical protein H8S90_04735 [Olivibacter sp. SDN3]|uniref:hypothetical protein n=1 Tax=Olivibacter sp. SDN3 TaxID=2764720 RepID=UPI0016519A6F|nr:hypothetical protein [Olivibacter sp. SDN3]QNL50898.1 hypothetical protein H8S90_04735 [Olivibacter sp. SDN3]